MRRAMIKYYKIGYNRIVADNCKRQGERVIGCFSDLFSINIPLLAVTAKTVAMITDVMFYVNLGLVFCALAEAAAFGALCKKTVCAWVVGLAAVFVFALGFIMYTIQLVLYSYGHSGTLYTVYFCFALFVGGLAVGAVYCIMLSRNSHPALCMLAGIFQIVPPVGAILAVALSYRIRRDNRAQELVFNGYAYTYAALGAFCKKNGADFADVSGDEHFERLNRKQLMRKLKTLKKQSGHDAKSSYDYAATLIHYVPYKYKKAVKLMLKSAEGGYSPALFNLGYYYETGAFVKKDVKRAQGFYRKAAESGDGDAALRLGIIAFELGNADEGLRIFNERSAKGDVCAEYNIGVCYECGRGVAQDVDKALEIYTACANRGLFTAQKRIFAMAATDINSAQNGEFFRRVTDRKFEGAFGVMIDGLIEVKKRLAADASEKFLRAVNYRDKWEGMARCLVGTLYIDCGKLPQDRRNGADYIKSAFGLTAVAREVYAVVPRSVINFKQKQ